MKLEDFGIDPETLRHNAVLTAAEGRFLAVLWTDHIGRENSLSAELLAIRFAGKMTGRNITMNLCAISHWKREVRKMQNHLLGSHKKVPVLSKAGSGGGYWIAESDFEFEEFYATFRKRGLTGLIKATRGKQAALVEMVEQLTFEFDDLVDAAGIVPPIRPRKPQGNVAAQMVDRFLEKMLSDPEKHTADLKKISEKFGAVLFSKVQMKALKEKLRELDEIVRPVEV